MFLPTLLMSLTALAHFCSPHWLHMSPALANRECIFLCLVYLFKIQATGWTRLGRIWLTMVW